jgi:hypothetical protein
MTGEGKRDKGSLMALSLTKSFIIRLENNGKSDKV